MQATPALSAVHTWLAVQCPSLKEGRQVLKHAIFEAAPDYAVLGCHLLPLLGEQQTQALHLGVAATAVIGWSLTSDGNVLRRALFPVFYSNTTD